MSARDRRLREAAAERDRQASDDVGESASFVAQQIRERRDTRDDDDDRQRSSPDRDRDRQPTPQPEPDDDQSVAEQIGELEPGEVLTATGGGGTGEADVEVISEEESRQRVLESQLVARTDLTRSELEGRQRFARQQTEFELLGRVEAQLEDRFGDVDFSAEDVTITE